MNEMQESRLKFNHILEYLKTRIFKYSSLERISRKQENDVLF